MLSSMSVGRGLKRVRGEQTGEGSKEEEEEEGKREEKRE